VEAAEEVVQVQHHLAHQKSYVVHITS